MMKTRFLCMTGVLLAMHTATLDAQQRTRTGSPDGGTPAPVVAPAIAADPAHPLVGVWQGTMTELEMNDEMPITVVIEFLNGAYSSYSIVGPGAAVHKSTKVTDKAIHWEQPNSGGGTLMFDLKISANDRMAGTMKLVGAAFTKAGAKLDLRRRAPKK